MKVKRILGILLMTAILFGTMAGCSGAKLPDLAAGDELPRNQTLYFAGLQWGSINGWNPLSGAMNNSMAQIMNGSGSRITMFETPYMFNSLDGKLYPLLADGDYQWNADMTELTYKIKSAAKWNDGSKVTAEDAAYTWACCKKYQDPQGINFGEYVDAVEAVDQSTVKVKAVLVNGKAANPMMVTTFIEQVYVMQKKWLQTLEARCNNDGPTMFQDFAEDAAYSGPYGPFFADDTKVVMVRNDNYWGKDKSMFGSLAVPKFLCHTIFESNENALVALQAGEVDVTQQFIADVQKLWLEQGLSISTYIDQPPYSVCENMPTMWYNLAKPGLDNVGVRKAIAMAVDYEACIENAMTGQSPTFTAVPRSVMNPTPGEQAMYNKSAVADLQWAGNDIDGANALLDSIGAAPGADGIRVLDGVRLSYTVSCPNGWTDWMAACEITAAAGAKIGIELATNYPEADPFLQDVTSASNNEFDLFMMWTNSASPIEPWGRARNFMSSEFNGKDGNFGGNYGHYNNPRVQELLAAIPMELDNGKLVEMYTELVKIYLTDVPSFSLMYRPNQFHTVNESVWTGFTEINDGRNVPPLHCTDGYAIWDLYNLKLVAK